MPVTRTLNARARFNMAVSLFLSLPRSNRAPEVENLCGLYQSYRPAAGIFIDRIQTTVKVHGFSRLSPDSLPCEKLGVAPLPGLPELA